MLGKRCLHTSVPELHQGRVRGFLSRAKIPRCRVNLGGRFLSEIEAAGTRRQQMFLQLLRQVHLKQNTIDIKPNADAVVPCLAGSPVAPTDKAVPLQRL
jgi:hypothetical protein